MDIAVLLFKQNTVMFIYLLIGCLLVKKKVLTVQGSAEIGKLLLYVIMPTAIVNSYLKDYSPQMLEKLLVSLLAALGGVAPVNGSQYADFS